MTTTEKIQIIKWAKKNKSMPTLIFAVNAIREFYIGIDNNNNKTTDDIIKGLFNSSNGKEEEFMKIINVWKEFIKKNILN